MSHIDINDTLKKYALQEYHLLHKYFPSSKERSTQGFRYNLFSYESIVGNEKSRVDARTFCMNINFDLL
jgi:hypothetical protein